MYDFVHSCYIQAARSFFGCSELFYHKQPKHKIGKDDEWIKKLKVREIDYIETTYMLDTTITIKIKIQTSKLHLNFRDNLHQYQMLCQKPTCFKRSS